MASRTKRVWDATVLERHAEADRLRDRAEDFEAAMTRHQIRLLGGSTIWERAAAGGVIPLR